MTIDGLALQELRDYHETALDDPQYVEDCPQGAEMSRQVLALLDWYDAQVDTPSPAVEAGAVREAQLRAALVSHLCTCGAGDKPPEEHSQSHSRCAGLRALDEALTAPPEAEAGEPGGRCTECGVIRLDADEPSWDEPCECNAGPEEVERVIVSVRSVAATPAPEAEAGAFHRELAEVWFKGIEAAVEQMDETQAQPGTDALRLAVAAAIDESGHVAVDPDASAAELRKALNVMRFSLRAALDDGGEDG